MRSLHILVRMLLLWVSILLCRKGRVMPDGSFTDRKAAKDWLLALIWKMGVTIACLNA